MEMWILAPRSKEAEAVEAAYDLPEKENGREGAAFRRFVSKGA